MWVLAAEDNMRCNELTMFIKHLEIMCYCHEVYLRREQLIIWMIPPLSSKDTKLLAINDGLDLSLNRRIILWCRLWEILRICFCAYARIASDVQLVCVENRRLEISRCDRVRSQRLKWADPVKRMEMVEMYQMILHRKRCSHDIADVISILRYLNTKSIFNCTNRCQRMSRSTYTTDTLYISPCIARVTILHYKF